MSAWLCSSATLACPDFVPPRGVDLALLGLDPEVEVVLGWQGVAHPDVFAVFQRLVLVAGGGDAVKAQLAKESQEHFLDQLGLHCTGPETRRGLAAGVFPLP